MKYNKPGGVRLPAWLQKNKKMARSRKVMTEIKRVGYYGWDTWVSAKAIQQTMQDFRIDISA